MTLNALIKQLQKLQAQGHGRSAVTVDKDSLSDGNGTWNICDINSVSEIWVRQVDGDGFGVFRYDGTEKGRTCIVLSGETKR